MCNLYKLVLAEKPSVGRPIDAALNANERKKRLQLQCQLANFRQRFRQRTCKSKNSLTGEFSHVRITTIFLKEAKLAVSSVYAAIVIMQRRLVADRGDGLLLFRFIDSAH